MKKRVAVVGATGVAGQQFLVALRQHPWFEVGLLAASERSAGKTYAEAIRDPKTGARQWWCQEDPPADMLDVPVQAAWPLDLDGIDLVFTAVESGPARELEPRYAATTPVVSTASAFRRDPDVPLLIPGVNLDHADLIPRQRSNRGWKGFIVTQPNCTIIGLVITLKPLFDRFELQRVVITSMQGLSGAGRSPGVIGMDTIDNIIPFISGEEEKVEAESAKILGRLENGQIRPAAFPVSATCTRVPVLEGHTESVLVSLAEPCSVDAARAALRDFGREFTEMGLPSAPDHMIVVHDDPYRPQPRLDRDAEDGMATSVGRLRADATLDNGLKYVLVSHNTKMGAAKGAVLTAEYLVRRGDV